MSDVWHLCRRGIPAEAESCVACKVLREDVPCRGKFPADEAEAHQPCPHREFGVFPLRFFGACSLEVFRRFGKGEAKLDVALEFACVEAAPALCRGVRELEEAKFNGAFGEGRVEVQAMVARTVVVLLPAVCGAVSFVPDVREFFHRLRLFLVEAVEEDAVHRAAVASEAALVDAHGGDQEAFVACHEVGKVSKRLRRVAAFADVDVHAAHMGGVALCSCMAQSAQKFLQALDVFVVQDGRDQFGLLGAASGFDADVALEFPLASLVVPDAPCAVAVTVCRVLEVSRAEEVCRDSRCVSAADAVHLDFHPDGLPFHVCNLPCRFHFHLEAPLSSLSYGLFSCIYITLKATYSKRIAEYTRHFADFLRCIIRCNEKQPRRAVLLFCAA